jgi:competence protein ComEA
VAAGARDTRRTAVLDLNRATAQELERLPGVGPALAARIVARRDSIGGFRAVEELETVRGIGPVLVEKLKPMVRVGT